MNLLATESLPEKPFRYFALPRELRNLVMEFAFAPGDIYIRVKGDHIKKPRFKYGVQLLATCRQAYAEGYPLYYGKNTFHLPSCDVDAMKEVLEAFQPKHLAIVKSLIVNCSFNDILSADSEIIWGEWRADIADEPSLYADHAAHDLIFCIGVSWNAKIYWLLHFGRVLGLHFSTFKIIDPNSLDESSDEDEVEDEDQDEEASDEEEAREKSMEVVNIEDMGEDDEEEEEDEDEEDFDDEAASWGEMNIASGVPRLALHLVGSDIERGIGPEDGDELVEESLRRLSEDALRRLREVLRDSIIEAYDDV